jgi:DNA replication and repair protein RecF
MLSRLVIRDFRNFSHLDVVVPLGGLVIVGENGHGKSNLLEAVAYLSLLRSSRGARDADCIRFGASAFHVRAETAGSASYHTIGIGYERSTKRKRASLDGVDQPRLSNALGALPSVSFAPADVSLVAGGPAERRRYLDVVLALTSPTYLAALQQYRAALLRRNAELRLAQRDGARNATQHDARVSVWEPAMARHGAVITNLRSTFARSHADRFRELSASIGEVQPMTMRYVPSVQPVPHPAPGDSSSNDDAGAVDAGIVEAALAEALASQRAQEMRRGMTLVGPHRDDLQLLIGGRELRTFGSAGQQRSAAIALRLMELATLRESLGHTPLLLLDDPFAELDVKRAARVLSLLEHEHIGQVLLAVPRDEDVPDAFTLLERRVMTSGVLHECAT